MASIICISQDKLSFPGERKFLPEETIHQNFAGKPGVLIIHVTGTKKVTVVLEPKTVYLPASWRDKQHPGVYGKRNQL